MRRKKERRGNRRETAGRGIWRDKFRHHLFASLGGKRRKGEESNKGEIWGQGFILGDLSLLTDFPRLSSMILQLGGSDRLKVMLFCFGNIY